jgi:hypothetical protein
MLILREPYRPRNLSFVDVWTIGVWRLKVYTITRGPEPPPEALLKAAHRAAVATLNPARGHGCGFVGVHAGRDANAVFVAWWADENELHHRLHLSPVDDPGALRPAGPGDMTACVWDLALLAFEREVWVRTVLVPPDPSMDDYLTLRCDAVI